MVYGKRGPHGRLNHSWKGSRHHSSNALERMLLWLLRAWANMRPSGKKKRRTRQRTRHCWLVGTRSGVTEDDDLDGEPLYLSGVEDDTGAMVAVAVEGSSWALPEAKP